MLVVKFFKFYSQWFTLLWCTFYGLANSLTWDNIKPGPNPHFSKTCKLSRGLQVIWSSFHCQNEMFSHIKGRKISFKTACDWVQHILRNIQHMRDQVTCFLCIRVFRSYSCLLLTILLNIQGVPKKCSLARRAQSSLMNIYLGHLVEWKEKTGHIIQRGVIYLNVENSIPISD